MRGFLTSTTFIILILLIICFAHFVDALSGRDWHLFLSEEHEMFTSLFYRVHENFASLPSAVLTTLLIGASFVVFFIALLPGEYTTLKAVALAYVTLP